MGRTRAERRREDRKRKRPIYLHFTQSGRPADWGYWNYYFKRMPEEDRHRTPGKWHCHCDYCMAEIKHKLIEEFYDEEVKEYSEVE